MVGIGEASSLIHHAQIAWLPAAERRRYALTGPPPPDWFAEMRPAPWITPRVLAEGRKLAGASLVTVPASPVPALAAVPVPPGQQAPPPAETLSGVPPWDTTAAPADAPADQVTSGGDDLITGIAAAAGYLGYDKPDSFRRARTRHPIPGETRTPTAAPLGPPRPAQLARPAQDSKQTARQPAKRLGTCVTGIGAGHYDARAWRLPRLTPSCWRNLSSRVSRYIARTISVCPGTASPAAEHLIEVPAGELLAVRRPGLPHCRPRLARLSG